MEINTIGKLNTITTGPGAASGTSATTGVTPVENPFRLQLNALEQRMPFFSIHSHRARLERFLDRTEAGSGTETLLLRYRQTPEYPLYKTWNRADDAAIILTRRTPARDDNQDPPARTRFDLKTLYLRPLKNDVVLSKLPRIASSARITSRDSVFHRVALVPRTETVIEADERLLAENGIHRYESRKVKRLLLKLRSVLPAGNPLGLRIQRNGVIRLGNRWAWRPTEFWADADGNRVRFYNVLKSPDGRWHEVTGIDHSRRIEADRADKPRRKALRQAVDVMSEDLERLGYQPVFSDDLSEEMMTRQLIGTA